MFLTQWTYPRVKSVAGRSIWSFEDGHLGLVSYPPGKVGIYFVSEQLPQASDCMEVSPKESRCISP